MWDKLSLKDACVFCGTYHNVFCIIFYYNVLKNLSLSTRTFFFWLRIFYTYLASTCNRSILDSNIKDKPAWICVKRPKDKSVRNFSHSDSWPYRIWLRVMLTSAVWHCLRIYFMKVLTSCLWEMKKAVKILIFFFP